MLVSSTNPLYTLWMSRKSAEPNMGHSPFVYISDRGDKDPFNRHLIVFMINRSERGDPTAYTMPKAEYIKGEVIMSRIRQTCFWVVGVFT